MTEEAEKYETKRLDHLGIVAGVCKRIKLIELIDGTLPTPGGRKVSCGEATQAMVLNALGLTGRALYLMPEYLANKPVDILIREGLEAEDFNDDTLGRALDELQQAGVTEMFATIAGEAVREYGIEIKQVHVDSSTLSVHGEYDSEYAQGMTEKFGTCVITQGYSKEQRPDLKQVVVNLITSQASALPLWLEALDGNSSDTKTFEKTVTTYCKQLQEGAEMPLFVMDSAAYSAENLGTWQTIPWLTRVPERLTAAKQLLTAVPTAQMTDVGNGYHICAVGTWYADVKQRWLLVYSEQAHKREQLQFIQRLAHQQPAHEKKWRKLCRTHFQCQADAQTALDKFDQQLPYCRTLATLEPLKKYAQRGRPAATATAQIVGWRITGELLSDDAAIADHLQWLGRFILATNRLDEQAFSDAEMLSAYKQQASSVERGFRFLKDPMFFADSLFLKSPVRIMAMIMVMGLALLIYSLAERELRLALVAHNETLPHQTGRPTQQITMRRVAQIFEGVDLLIVRRGSTVIERHILNLTPLRLKILHLFHPLVLNCYLLE